MSTMHLPIVTDADRDWAMAQCPSWAKPFGLSDDGEIVDDSGWLDAKRERAPLMPIWHDFVTAQADKFEKFFEGQMKTYGDWSRLWRRSWWPKSDPYRRWPSMAKKEFQPFFRKGTAEFVRAIEVASPQEKPMWLRFGVAQFKPDDKRLPHVVGPQQKPFGERE